MTTPDLLYLAFIAAALLLDHFVMWPSFLRRSDADAGRARRWVWSGWMTMLWTLTAAGTALWLATGRAWGSLRLTVLHGWGLWSGIALVAAVAFVYGRSALKVSRIPAARRAELRSKYGDLAAVLPHTRPELVRFVALSLTAGFCEEFVYRGYLIWAFEPALGLWGAAALSVVAFALSHAYQGRRGILQSGVMGALLTLIVLGTGSLLPAIALHALIDIGSGVMARLVLGAEREAREALAGVDESTSA